MGILGIYPVYCVPRNRRQEPRDSHGQLPKAGMHSEKLGKQTPGSLPLWDQGGAQWSHVAPKREN